MANEHCAGTARIVDTRLPGLRPDFHTEAKLQILDRLPLARRLRRSARRFFSRMTLPRAQIVYSREYKPPPNDFSDPERAARILDYLMYEGCMTRHHLLRPRRATISDLNLVHPYSYLSRVGEPERMERVFGADLFQIDANGFIEQQRWLVGGTVRAAQSAIGLLGPRTVVNLGGGLHHAYADGGYGFCVFNDVAIAISRLRKDGYKRRILIVDLDLHQGDGTRTLFAEDPDVFTFSVHAESWDTTRIEGDIDVALGAGIGDDAYLRAIRRYLPEAFARARPHLVFYLAGVDVAETDKLGNWRVTPEGILARDRLVQQHIGNRPSVWLLAGGYGNEAWRYSARTISWLLNGYDAPIPSSAEKHLAHYRGIAAGLGAGDLAVENDEFGITEADLFGDLAKPGYLPTRLLDYYTVYGIECALERYGVLERLRQIGIPRVFVEFELDHPTGQMVRVYSDDARKDLLVELVLDEKEDQKTGWRLLWIEWLLLQNPRREPDPTRPLLPGQEHPGLGVLDQVLGMLVMAAERLEFDAVAFNPAHYHIAALSRGAVSFINPEAEGRFLAMEGALSGLRYAEIREVLQSGTLKNGETGAGVGWTSSTMALPVSEKAKQWFNGQDYAMAVEQSAASHNFELEDRVPGPPPRVAQTRDSQA